MRLIVCIVTRYFYLTQLLLTYQLYYTLFLFYQQLIILKLFWAVIEGLYLQKPGTKYTTIHSHLLIGLFVIKTSFVFRRASIVAIGEGKTSLNCLQGCDQKIPLSSIQKALDQKTFSKWVQRIQLAEVKQVNNYLLNMIFS